MEGNSDLVTRDGEAALRNVEGALGGTSVVLGVVQHAVGKAGTVGSIELMAGRGEGYFNNIG